MPHLWLMALIVGIPTLYFSEQNRVLTFIIYAFDLQGLPALFCGLNNIWPSILGIGQLWFLTVIFICYIIMFFLKKFEVDKWIEHNMCVSIIVTVIVTVICGLIKIQLTYIIVYFIGYFWKRCIYKLNIGMIRFCGLSIFTFGICLIRIILRNTIDGTPIYDCFIARVSMAFLAIWIITGISQILEQNMVMGIKVANSKMWNCLEQLSYSLFVVHYAFLVGIFDISKFFGKGIVGILAFIAVTVIGAILLNAICGKINSYYKNMRVY